MSKTKQDYLNELALIAFRMDEKANLSDERTRKYQRLAFLAKKGLKETEEYKRLEYEIRQPTVTDFGDEMRELQRVVKQLKRYKWDYPETFSSI